MGDFFQQGGIATLHQLGRLDFAPLEAKIAHHAQKRPISLILPCQYADLEGDAWHRIRDHLMHIGYLRRIVVGLDQVKAEEFGRTRDQFAHLPQETRVVWTGGPAMESLCSQLWAEGFLEATGGKGRALWMCIGYILACRDTEVIVVHDCDILTYDRLLLGRLAYPLVVPDMEYDFVKGYYARVTDRLHGRVTRLFVTPFMRALRSMLGPLPFLEYLDSYRYPLSSEFSLRTFLARSIQVPSNLGLEIGLLCEAYRNCTPRHICQVDLSIDYEHKHELSYEDPTKGLLKMCIDIAGYLFATLAAEGIVFTDNLLRTIRATYHRTAEGMVRVYEDDAAINGLSFDRHAEMRAVQSFLRGLEIAGQNFMQEPISHTSLTEWSTVISVLPTILDELHDVVEHDNKKP